MFSHRPKGVPLQVIVGTDAQVSRVRAAQRVWAMSAQDQRIHADRAVFDGSQAWQRACDSREAGSIARFRARIAGGKSLNSFAT
jgi:hypothetical protein